MRYLAHSDADRREMLRSIGVPSIDALFADLPRAVVDAFRPLGRGACLSVRIAQVHRLAVEVRVFRRRDGGRRILQRRALALCFRRGRRFAAANDRRFVVYGHRSILKHLAHLI